MFFFHTGQTTTAMAGQLLYSILAVTVNLVLVGAALGHKSGGSINKIIHLL